MRHRATPLVMLLTLILAISSASAEQRGRGGEGAGGDNSGGGRPGGSSSSAEKSGSKPPGGAWSSPSGKKPASSQGDLPGNEDKKNPFNANNPQGAAAAANKSYSSNPSGAEDAAAGAAASRRNQPTASGAEGAAAGAAAANKNQPTMSGAQGAAVGATAAKNNQPAVSGAAGYAAVRDSFDHPSLYSPEWHGDNQAAWTASNWPANAAYTNASHAAVAAHCGYQTNAAVSYGYGDNVNYENQMVVVNGQVAGSAAAYSQQAAQMANNGRNATTTPADDWLPLGVFALVPSEDQQPQLTVQLAINKQGVLRGNYTELVSDHTQLIHGMVDPQTQRAAWTVGDSEGFYMEAGLKNLTDGDAPVLIHRRGKTERWVLVSLPQPQIAAANSNNPGNGN